MSDNKSKSTKAAYRVTVKRDGFRRLGREWTGATELGKEEIKPEDIDLLKKDPMFVVEVL